MDRDQTISRRAVEGLIAEGRLIVVFEDYILRLDSWANKHPGGRLALMHMVGRDATDEIKVYHSDATLKTMKAYRIARKQDGPWINMTPPIRGGIYRKLETTPSSTSIEPTGSDTEEDGQDTTDDGSTPTSDQSSFTSDSSSLSSIKEKVLQETLIRRKAHGRGGHAVGREPNAPAPLAMSPAEYTNLLMQQEIDEGVKEFPSLDPLVQQDVVMRYRELHERVRNEGFYDCPYIEYGKEIIRYSVLFTAFLVALKYEWYMTSAICLGLFWQQIMFSAHDAGHHAITHIFVVDSLIALFIADFCCGLSMGWWKSSHNVHHLVTNQPEHDPDIQNIPLFATGPSFFKGINSTYYEKFVFVWDSACDFMVSYQQYTYYPIMAFARFNLYMLSWIHVLSKRSSSLGNSTAWWIRPTEVVFMTAYWYLFGYVLVYCSLPTWTMRVLYVVVSHMATAPLHVQITLSHWGMPTSDLGESESFPQRQLRTTMDVDCPVWLDFFHGGLQFQAVHHLFPRVPRHNLRRLQVLVREFCKDTKIPYAIYNFKDGNKKVLNRLEEVAEQVKILIECQKYMAKTGESGLH